MATSKAAKVNISLDKKVIWDYLYPHNRFGGLVPDCSRATPLFGVRRRLTKANYINLS